MKAVLFDVEGVLIDVSERLKSCLAEVNNALRTSYRSVSELRGKARRLFWDCFLSEKYAHLDKPLHCNIERAKKLQSEYEIILVTGAPLRIAKRHAKLLRSLGLRFRLFARPEGDKRPSNEFKNAVVASLVKEGYEFVAAYDDDESNCEALAKYAKEVYIVKGCEVKPFRMSLLSFLND